MSAVLSPKTQHRAAAVGGVVLLLPLASCGGNSIDDYCGAVKEHQTQLTNLFSEQSNAAIFKALPTLRDLRDAAPDDIRADWNQLVSALTQLQEALHDAGVTPEQYHAGKPPAGISAADRAKITAAANAVGDAQTASAQILQQVRDVCHTQLTL